MNQGRFNVTVPPTAALALSLHAVDAVDYPQLYGTPHASVHLDASSGELSISGAQGEAGTSLELLVLLPLGSPQVRSMLGLKVPCALRRFDFEFPRIKTTKLVVETRSGT